jgi:hypothetical protein
MTAEAEREAFSSELGIALQYCQGNAYNND